MEILVNTREKTATQDTLNCPLGPVPGSRVFPAADLSTRAPRGMCHYISQTTIVRA